MIVVTTAQSPQLGKAHIVICIDDEWIHKVRNA